MPETHLFSGFFRLSWFRYPSDLQAQSQPQLPALTTAPITNAFLLEMGFFLWLKSALQIKFTEQSQAGHNLNCITFLVVRYRFGRVGTPN